MKILVTNDDGIDSPVLTLLADALAPFHSVHVIAPATDQSGMSQAFTHGTEKFLRYHRHDQKPYSSIQVFGTPCDCVKFGIAHLQQDEPFDLVLSGINLGENAGMSAVYSGTVAAAREGAMWGIPALAVSVWKNAPDHLDYAVKWIVRLLSSSQQASSQQPSTQQSPSQPLPIRPGGLWNINFPACDPGDILGYEFTTMSTVMFADSYENVLSQHDLTQYRLVGYKPHAQFLPGTDDHALAHNKIAITPLQVDQSDIAERNRLSQCKLFEEIPGAIRQDFP